MIPAVVAVSVILIFKLITVYFRRRSLPPGPFPMPLIGNITSMFGRKEHPHVRIMNLSQKYGPIMTLFLGGKPLIVISDPAMVVSEIRRHQFAGRPDFEFAQILFRPGSSDVVFSDFTKEWEALRRVLHSAANKFSVSHIFHEIVCEVVDSIIDEKSGSPFSSMEVMSLLITNILSRAAFGRKYEFDDPDFLRWQSASRFLDHNFNFIQMVSAFKPMKYVYWSKWNQFQKNSDWSNDYIEKMYEESSKNYVGQEIRTFCHAIIAAKEEAEAEDNWILKYMKPGNMLNIVHNMFQAGADTTIVTLRWLFLLMAKYPEMQQRMRQEVDTVIGSDEPQDIHRKETHYVNAFISECMRLKGIAPFAVFHKATVDSQIGGYDVKQGTSILFMIYSALHDEKTWPQAEEFRPDRFLSPDGKYISRPNDKFVPFGDGGRRSCPGKKLAITDVFLVACRFLQRTENITVLDVENVDMRGDVHQTTLWSPHDYQIELRLR